MNLLVARWISLYVCLLRLTLTSTILKCVKEPTQSLVHTHMCVCVCIYIYVYMYICARIDLCIYIYSCVYIYIYIYVHMIPNSTTVASKSWGSVTQRPRHRRRSTAAAEAAPGFAARRCRSSRKTRPPRKLRRHRKDGRDGKPQAVEQRDRRQSTSEVARCEPLRLLKLEICTCKDWLGQTAMILASSRSESSNLSRAAPILDAAIRWASMGVIYWLLPQQTFHHAMSSECLYIAQTPWAIADGA